MVANNSESQLNLRLPANLKRMIEQAAAQLGQAVSEFAISSLAAAARKVLHEQSVTTLSERDRKRFMSLLDDRSVKPNKALAAAARRYKKQIG